MAEHYFHVEDGAITAGPTPKRGIRDPHVSLTGNEDDATLKALGWLPQVKVGDVPATDTQVKTGPVDVPEPEGDPVQVTSTWTIRPKTQAELDAELAAHKEAEARLIDQTLGKALFIHENRIRALEGKAPITVQQFRDWFKDQVT